MAAVGEDLADRIAKGFAIFILDAEVLRDPLLVEDTKSFLVAGLEAAQENVRANMREGGSCIRCDGCVGHGDSGDLEFHSAQYLSICRISCLS